MLRPAHLPALDGLRGIAVLLVIAFHWHYLGCGWAGVQLFFVLSGFLITRLLLADRDQPVRPFLVGFYRRRAARIFPLYFGYLLLLSAVFVATGAPRHFGEYAASLFTYTFNFARLRTDWAFSPFFAHFWSLAIEEQFYLLWPIGVWLLPPRWLRPVVVVGIAAPPVLRYAMSGWLRLRGYAPVDVVEVMNTFTLAQVDALAIGAALAVFGLEKRERGRGVAFLVALAIAAAAGAAELVSLRARGAPVGWSSFGYPQPMQADAQVVWGTTVLNLLFGAAVLAAPRARWLSARPLREIGRVSYGMYVFHLPAIRLLSEVWPADPWSLEGLVKFGLYLGGLWAAAELSFRFFEAPISRWARERPAATFASVTPRGLPEG